MEEKSEEKHIHEHKEHHAAESALVKERTEKVLNFFKNNWNIIIIIALIALIVLGVYIRNLPLTDHSGKPGLWDITTNDYTLGPDLDPFLFLRNARTIISTGSLPSMDTFRNVPLGFDNSLELQMVSYMIVLTYKIVNMFGTYSANFAGAFMPVWIFAFTILFFFLFVREIFIRKSDKESELRANIIAVISTLFMIVIPELLSRTIAGIPEKESVGFCFMFLAFYLFLKAWKSEKIIYASIFGVLSGIATMLMGMTWGGVTYIYITIGLAVFIAFALGKVSVKEALVYILWLVTTLGLLLTFTNKYTLVGFATSLTTGITTLTFVLIVVDLIIWNTGINNMKILSNSKLPRSVISLIITLVLGLIATFFISPTFILDKIVDLNRILIQPVVGRWNTTVAENKQPYLNEWLGGFGNAFFFMFLAGSILLFKKMLDKAQLEKKQGWILTGLYAFFLFGLIFSRYAPHPAMFDGEGIESKLLYYGSALILVGFFIYFYIKGYIEKKESIFKNIDFEYLFLFALLVLCLFTARSAIRLIMVLAPIAPIFLAYLLVEPSAILKKIWRDKSKEITKWIIFICLAVAIILSFTSLTGFYGSIKSQAYNMVPYYYTLQWQEAMSWVRDNTPANSVFAHWWDYGYWVQTMGQRATVLDGGNAIAYWDHLMGRHVLTAANETEVIQPIRDRFLDKQLKAIKKASNKDRSSNIQANIQANIPANIRANNNKSRKRRNSSRSYFECSRHRKT